MPDYDFFDWQTGPGGGTAITEARLEQLEIRLKEYTDAVVDEIFDTRIEVALAGGGVGIALDQSGYGEAVQSDAANTAWTARLVTDQHARWRVRGDGAHEFGPGNGPLDVSFKRENLGSGIGLSLDQILYAKSGLEVADLNSGAYITTAGLIEGFASTLTEPVFRAGYTNNGAWPDSFPRMRILANGSYLVGTGADDATAGIYFGTGTPEAQITAPVGSIFLRRDGGANTTLYVKQSGVGNTGWVAK